MSVRPQDPGPGNNGSVTRWLYCAIPNGTATCGFLAAHPFGFWMHQVGRISKPCRMRTTGGALACGYCTGECPTWRGYTPFYSREYRRMFVLIASDTLEAVREIEPRTMIKLSREKDQRASVMVRPDTWRTSPLPPCAERDRPIDLVPFLLKLWKDEELLRWHHETTAPPAPPAPPVEPPAHEEVPPEILARSRQVKPNRASDPAAVGPLADMLLAGGRESGLYTAQRNGKFKPK